MKLIPEPIFVYIGLFFVGFFQVKFGAVVLGLPLVTRGSFLRLLFLVNL